MTRPAFAALLCGASLLSLSPLAALAQAPEPVDPLVVTASRLPAPLALTPGAYELDGERIARRGAPVVADLLTQVPGASLTQSGAFGGVASVRLRGASADKTLVLLDGVPLNDPSAPAGGFDASSLDTAGLDRIEVLTGPQGSLWGSDAIGGVVAITTRELDGVSLAAEGGSLATVRTASALGRATDRYAFGAAVATFRTEGVSKADVRDGNPERDGFGDTTVSANLRLSPNGRVTLDARARYNLAATEYDAGFGGPTGVSDSDDRTEVRTVSGFVRARVTDVLGFDQTLRADLMDLDRQSYGAFPYGARGAQQVLRWSAERQRKTYGLAFGAEHRSAQANTGDGRQTLDATGVYAIGRWSPVERVSLTGSLRRDEPQRYAGQTTGRVAVAAEAGAGVTLKASWGQGFKVPSIFETAYPCFECAVPGPNRALRPERAEGWDAGLAWRSPGGVLQVQATWFSLAVRDQIDYRVPVGYLNVARVKSTGVEAGLDARLPFGFEAHAAYTHDDAYDGPAWTRSLKVPRDTGSASLGWRGRGLTLDAGLRSQGAAPDVYGTIRPFTVAWLSGAYAVTREASLTLRVENLGDARYQQAFGYGEPGRTVMIGVRWRN